MSKLWNSPRFCARSPALVFRRCKESWHQLPLLCWWHPTLPIHETHEIIHLPKIEACLKDVKIWMTNNFLLLCVATSWMSGSSSWPWEACCVFSSPAFAGLCLKCTTILRHLANAPSNPLLLRDTMINLYRVLYRADGRRARSLLQPSCCEHYLSWQLWLYPLFSTRQKLEWTIIVWLQKCAHP